MTEIPLTEKALQAQVHRMCTQLGLYHYHPLRSIGSAPGWPDSVIINGSAGRIIFRELKTQGENPTAAQKHVGWMLQACGLDWAVWRTQDLIDGTIARELADLAAPVRRTS